MAVIAGLVYNFLPFMTLPIYASLEKVDGRLVEAAGDLYCSPFTGFRKVTWPLSLPGVVAGTLLTFIPASGDYINAQLLGTPKQYMVGNRIQSAFLIERNYPLAASLSLLLMAIVLVMVVAYVRRVEQFLIDVCAEMGLATVRVDRRGWSGVWVPGGDGPPRKVAAIGIRVAQGVTMHGFALNCDCDLRWYDDMVPCGIPDAGVTSLSAELGRPVTVAEITPVVERHLTTIAAPERTLVG